MITVDHAVQIRIDVRRVADQRLRQLRARIVASVGDFRTDARLRSTPTAIPPKRDDLACNLFRALASGLRGLLATTPCAQPDTVTPIYLFYGWAAGGLDRLELVYRHPGTGRNGQPLDGVLDDLVAAAEQHTQVGCAAALEEAERTLGAVLVDRDLPADSDNRGAHERYVRALCDDMGVIDPARVELHNLVDSLWRAWNTTLTTPGRPVTCD